MKRFLRSMLPLTLLVSVASATAAEPRVERSIAYLGTERAEKADLYLPADPPAGARMPAVVVIHGGGWSGGERGTKREINICTTLAEHGFAALTIDYRLGPKGNVMEAWPQNLHDCKTAVRWLRANAAKYGLDPARIGAIGGSAGGHLAALVGVTQPKDGLDPAGPYGDQSAAVSCVVDLYGPIHMKTGPIDAKSDLKTSPITYLDPQDPPFLLLHGTADAIVSPERSKEMAAALVKAGVTNDLVIVDGAPHTFDLQPKQRDLRPLVVDFFEKHLKSGR